MTSEDAVEKHYRKVKTKIIRSASIHRRGWEGFFPHKSYAFNVEKLIRIVKHFTGKTDEKLVEELNEFKKEGYEKAIIYTKDEVLERQLKKYILKEKGELK